MNARPLLLLLSIALTALAAGCNACSDDPPVASTPSLEVVDDEGVGKAKSGGPLAIGPDRRTSGANGGVVTPEEDRPLSPEVAAARDLITASPASAEQLTSALAQLEAALLAKSDDVDAIYWKGRALYATKRFPEALTELSRARTAAPTFLGPARWETTTLLALRRCEDAVPLLSALITAAPDDANAWYNRGACHFAARRFPEALSDAEKACSLGHQLACKTVPRIERRREQHNERVAKGEPTGEGSPMPGLGLPLTAPDGSTARPGVGGTDGASKGKGKGKGKGNGKSGKLQGLGKAKGKGKTKLKPAGDDGADGEEG